MSRASRFLALILLLLAVRARAVTYLVPPDVEMIQGSDDIVLARAVSSRVEWSGRSIVTRNTLLIEEVLKGPRAVGSELVLTERGGSIDGRISFIPGTPRYTSGERYLVFTDAGRDGESVTFGMSLGQFRFMDAGGRSLAMRDDIEGFDRNLEPWAERARDTGAFLQYIREVAAGGSAPAASYFVDSPPIAEVDEVSAQALTRGSYLLFEDGMPFRWSSPSASVVRSGKAAGGLDGDAAVALAFAQWNGTDSDIDYRDAGRDNSAVAGLTAEDGKHAILLNDPNHEVGSGILGIGGVTVGANPYALDGEQFWDMVEVDAVISGVAMNAQSCLNTVVVHEVGHTLGFRHSNQPRSGGDSTTNAIMNASVACTWNGILKVWDKAAANRVYGEPPVCEEPFIRTQPASQTIKGGTTLSLGIVADGTASLRYQWYEGTPRDTSYPLGPNRPSLKVPLMRRSTSYWVRVTNGCGKADSEAATITVTPSRRRAVR